VPLLLAPKTGGLIKNFSSSGFSIVVSFVTPYNDDPVFLTPDSHGSHIILLICNCIRENEINVVSIPLHTSHRLQPPYLRLYGPLKAALNRKCRLYLERSAREEITEFWVSELFNKCDLQVTALEIRNIRLQSCRC
jgi:hypothetical protein